MRKAVLPATLLLANQRFWPPVTSLLQSRQTALRRKNAPRGPDDAPAPLPSPLFEIDALPRPLFKPFIEADAETAAMLGRHSCFIRDAIGRPARAVPNATCLAGGRFTDRLRCVEPGTNVCKRAIHRRCFKRGAPARPYFGTQGILGFWSQAAVCLSKT